MSSFVRELYRSEYKSQEQIDDAQCRLISADIVLQLADAFRSGRVEVDFQAGRTREVVVQCAVNRLNKLDGVTATKRRIELSDGCLHRIHAEYKD